MISKVMGSANKEKASERDFRKGYAHGKLTSLYNPDQVSGIALNPFAYLFEQKDQYDRGKRASHGVRYVRDSVEILSGLKPYDFAEDHLRIRVGKDAANTGVVNLADTGHLSTSKVVQKLVRELVGLVYEKGLHRTDEGRSLLGEIEQLDKY